MLGPEDKTELSRLEEAMWRPHTRFDLAFQEARFAQDFVEFGRSGRVYNRAQIIRTDTQPIEATLPLPGLAFRQLDKDTVLLTYNSEAVYDGVRDTPDEAPSGRVHPLGGLCDSIRAPLTSRSNLRLRPRRKLLPNPCQSLHSGMFINGDYADRRLVSPNVPEETVPAVQRA